MGWPFSQKKQHEPAPEAATPAQKKIILNFGRMSKEDVASIGLETLGGLTFTTGETGSSAEPLTTGKMEPETIKNPFNVTGGKVRRSDIENIANAATQSGSINAAVAVIDAANNEKIVLFTDDTTLTMKALMKTAQATAPALIRPLQETQVNVLPQMPLLATGKIDYKKLRQAAKAAMAALSLAGMNNPAPAPSPFSRLPIVSNYSPPRP